MTLKKSLISVAAAGLLVSAITGCSSNSSTTAATTTTSNPTSLTAVDGYVLNATITATYGDGNDSNISYATTSALTNAMSYASVAAGGTQTAGSPVIDLSKDLTAAQIANLQSVTLSYKPQSTDGTKLTYATFFDVNGDNKFDTTQGDIAAPTGFSLTAPVGYKIISPVTTMIATRIAAVTAGDTNATTRATNAAAAESAIIAALGLTADKVKNIDPTTTVSTDPAYALINAMLGQVIYDGEQTAVSNALAASSAASSAPAALANIASGATTSKAFFGDAAKQLAADPNMINSVSSWNLDLLRNTSGASAFNPVNLTPGSADFNVSAITMGTNNLATTLMAGSGAKVDFGGLDNTKIQFAAQSDTNVSATQLKLAIDVRQQQTHRLDEANITSLTILIPFDINNTVGETNRIDGAVSGTVMWEGVRASGATFSGEMNASAFTNNDGSSGVTSGIAFNTTGLATIKVGSIISAIDLNSSSLAGIVDNNVSSIKVALVDVNGTKLQRVNSVNGLTQYWSNTAVASVKGGISVTGKTIFANSLTDSRSDATTASPNLIPQGTIALAKENNNDNQGAAISGAGTLASPYILNNNTDYNGSLTIAAGGQGYEANTTFGIVSLGNQSSYITDKNSSAINGQLYFATDTRAGTYVATNLFDVNTTVTTAGELNSTITYKLTDEFGDYNTSYVYVTVNRAPSFDHNSSVSNAVMDYNVTSNDATGTSQNIAMVVSTGASIENNGTDGNLTLNGIQIADVDGVSLFTADDQDWNLTVVGATTGCTYITTGDDGNTTLQGKDDANITLWRSVSGAYQLGIRDYNGSSEISCEYTLRAYDNHNYSATSNANDKNITINFRGNR